MRFIKIGLGAIALAALLVFMSSGPEAAHAAPVPTNDSYSIDADPVTSGIQNTINVSVGSNFDVAWVVGNVVGNDPWTAEQGNMQWNPAVVSFVSGPVDTGLGSAIMCGGTTGANYEYWGCARVSGFTSAEGVARTMTLHCDAPGVSALHLQTIAQVGVPTGTEFAIAAGVGDPSLNGKLFDATVNCVEAADLQIDKVADNYAPLAGSDVTYTITFHNAGPQTANPPVVITDMLPAGKEFVSCHVLSPIPADCSAAYVPPPAHMVQFPLGMPDGMGGVIPIPIPPSTTVIIQIVVHVPLSEAGKTNVNYVRVDGLAGPGDPDMTNNEDTAIVLVTASDVSISKHPTTPSVMVGNPVTWKVPVVVGATGSPAGDVIITDTVDSQQTITVATVDGTFTCDENTGTNVAGLTAGAGNTATCTLEQPVPAGTTVTMTVTADVSNQATGPKCHNDATVTFAEPTTLPAEADVECISEVSMLKTPVLDQDVEVGTAPDGTPLVNLWVCTAAGCDQDKGQGKLVVNEEIKGVGDPDGAGAFEFQLKFDHKIFDINISEGPFLASNYRWTNCSMSIINENAILFGCVSKNPVMVYPWWPNIPTGPTGNGVGAVITLVPESDMQFRLTPGQDNGVVRRLLDENCEIADVLGDPLATGVDPVTHRPILQKGILPGGGVEKCADLTLTVRILEGDLNLDCSVDVTDDQAIAYRYGASFGNLLYDPWFDLEPALKDFDIDIKDLQKVFGRNGSTCENPIPAYQIPEDSPAY
jgi:uncharacterized repeat protein (TIGR01451 family)/fimbrial isopeptide formation D2 family protein